MNLTADESVDEIVVDRLRQAGYAVIYIAELSPGITDDEVLRTANDHTALLITADKDFGELVFRQGLVHSGIVLLRLAGLSPSVKADTVVSVFHDHGLEFPGSFTVVSPGMVRIRPRDVDHDVS